MKIPFLDTLTAGQRKIILVVAGGSILCTLGISAFLLTRQSKQALNQKKSHSARALLPVKKAYTYVDLSPLDIGAHLTVARQYLKQDRPDKAIPHFLRVLPFVENDYPTLVDLATAYLSSFEYQKALSSFRELEETVKPDSLLRVVEARYGLSLLLAGRAPEAVALLESCLKTDPHNAEALCYLGQAQASLSVDSAIVLSYFQKATSAQPENIEARYQQARYLMERGNYTVARDSFQRILSIDPLNIRTHSRLGMIYYYLKQPEFALKSYETALALNPDDYNTHYNLGELLFTYYQDNLRALTEFKRTIELKPNHAEANFKIGLICLNNQMNREAAGYLESACAFKPNTVRYMLQLAVAYEKIGLSDKAADIYATILEIDALNPIALQKAKMLQSKS